MEKFPLKGSREAAAEGNNYITAYQTVMKKVRVISDKQPDQPIIYAEVPSSHISSNN